MGSIRGRDSGKSTGMFTRKGNSVFFPHLLLPLVCLQSEGEPCSLSFFLVTPIEKGRSYYPA